MGLWVWHTKKQYFHTNFVHFFEAVNCHTKKTKKTKQGALHTNSVNMASFFYYESYIGVVVKWKVHNGGLVLKKSNIHFLKQFCLYFNYMTLTV